MMKLLKKLFKEEEGQALTEYGLLVGLISIAVIGALVLLGPKISEMFTKITTELSKVVTK